MVERSTPVEFAIGSLYSPVELDLTRTRIATTLEIAHINAASILSTGERNARQTFEERMSGLGEVIFTASEVRKR